MNKEIEVKILEIDKEVIIEQLELLGAIKTRDEILHVQYFDVNEKQSEFLRIRNRGDQYELTYKKVTKGVTQVNDEIELLINDAEAMTEILELLGVHQYKTREKQRISYTLGENHFDLDKYKDLPWFMEIEGSTEEAIFDMIRQLGLQDLPTTSLGYSDLVADYDTIVKNALGINY